MPVAAIAAVLVVIAAVIGYLVAPSSTKKKAQTVAFSQQASSGPITISYPSGWSRASAAPAGVASLKLSDPLTLSPGPSAPGGALVTGISKTQSASLLPASFTGTLSSPPQAATVKLGNQTYKRYLLVQPKGAGTPESIYVLPTSVGTATAVCVVPQSNATQFAVTCEHAVGTMTIKGSVLPLGANPAYAHSLSGVIAKLNSARGSLGGKLASAKTPAAQASAAGGLSAAYGHAAAAVSKLTPGPAASGANAALAAALGQLQRGYGSLSAAAAHHNGGAYRSAQGAIGRAQHALSAAFGQLRQDGYKIG